MRFIVLNRGRTFKVLPQILCPSSGIYCTFQTPGFVIWLSWRTKENSIKHPQENTLYHFSPIFILSITDVWMNFTQLLQRKEEKSVAGNVKCFHVFSPFHWLADKMNIKRKVFSKISSFHSKYHPAGRPNSRAPLPIWLSGLPGWMYGWINLLTNLCLLQAGAATHPAV